MLCALFSNKRASFLYKLTLSRDKKDPETFFDAMTN